MASPMVIHYISKDSHQAQQHAWVGKGRDHSFNFFGGQSKYFDMGYPLDFPRSLKSMPLGWDHSSCIKWSLWSHLIIALWWQSSGSPQILFFMMIHQGHSTVATACMGIRDHSPLSFKKSLKSAICKFLPCFVVCIIHTKQRTWSIAIYNRVWFECHVI